MRAIVNEVRIYHFKENNSELIDCPLCFENISKDFSDDKKKQTRLNRYVYNFLVGYGGIDIDDILDFHKYLICKNIIK